MSAARQQVVAPEFTEDIRLVIWDLDETFWDGTLTEGGIRYRRDHHDLVKTLARRGIMSSICSKNDQSVVAALLRKEGLWDTFIFPSIDWTLKGARITAMLDEIGLRPASVLFVDDNAMNRAQAAHMNPGLQVAGPEIIVNLADMPGLVGKPDPGLTRLRQYQVKERKAQAVAKGGGDTIAFLRQSDVRVCIEYDVEAHLDRAVELIQRTNQLNFTKSRLPEGPEEARAELLALLGRNTTDAGLIRVRDAYGDYGFVGFYLTQRMQNRRRLKHFCFSCRTLNMYVEHWAHRHLGRPALSIVGEVLSDPLDDAVDADWVRLVAADQLDAARPVQPVRFDRIMARGGCDLASLMHYFSGHADTLVEEFNEPRNGQMFRRDHTAFLLPALDGGLPPAQQEAAALLGYRPDDFGTELFDSDAGPEAYFLSLWADADIPVYRHRATGLEVPYWLVGAQNHDLIERHELRHAVAKTDAHRARLDILCGEFEHVGLPDLMQMTARYTRILDRLPPDAPVVLVLANERGPLQFHDPLRPAHPHHQCLNTALRQVASGRDNVMLLDPMAHIHRAEDMIDLNHFKRPVYGALYRDALAQLEAWRA